MIRKDVYSLAARLNNVAALGTDSIYSFLMSAGKSLGKNPRLYAWKAEPGLVYLVGEHNNYRLESYEAPQPWDGSKDDETALYWEGRTLERQEAWQD